MTNDRAEQAVVVSAVVTSGIYFYRKLTADSLPAAKGSTAGSGGRAIGALLPHRGEQLAPVGKFLIGFAFAYMMISVIAMFAPGFGAMLAILLAVGSVLANGLAIFSDIQGRTA